MKWHTCVSQHTGCGSLLFKALTRAAYSNDTVKMCEIPGFGEEAVCSPLRSHFSASAAIISVRGAPSVLNRCERLTYRCLGLTRARLLRTCMCTAGPRVGRTRSRSDRN
jgi:hypothetical protein